MCKFSAIVALDKVTNGQTDIKHEMEKTLTSMSLLKFVGEKLLPSQKSIFNSDIELSVLDFFKLPYTPKRKEMKTKFKSELRIY